MPGSRLRRPGTRTILALAAFVFVTGLVLLVLDSSSITDTAGAVLVCAGWAVTAYAAVRQRDIAVQALRASREERKKRQDDEQKARRTLTTKISTAQAEQARQVKRQARSLARIEDALRQIQVSGTAGFIHTEPSDQIDVLFVTSNGAGLGHVTRLLAVAEQLPDGYRYELLTLSKAYEQVRAPGLTVHYFPSSDATQERPHRWNRVFRSYFRRLVEERCPRAVVFDGTWVYSGLTDVCRANDIPLIWVQRGMWKEEKDRTSRQRHDVFKVADEVIVPGDFAGSEDIDAGPGVSPLHVGPIVRTSRSDLLTRTEACEKLGLDPAGAYALVSVGRQAIDGDGSGSVDVPELVRELCPGTTPVQVVSPLAAAGSGSPHAEQIEVYPVMPLVRAFDFVVSAAGYNSSQEAVALGIPTILVPDLATVTDDQERRARLLAEKGLVLTAKSITELRDALASITTRGVREELMSSLSNIDAPRGAAEAAQALHEMVERSKWPVNATTIGSGVPSRPEEE